ncbi:MAG: DUF6364 family protein [Bacteroidota bacterium]
MLNVRLDEELEKRLKQYSEKKSMSKSSLVKEALVEYFRREDFKQSPYELGSDLFGLAGSNNPKASTTYKKQLKEKLREKHSH